MNNLFLGDCATFARPVGAKDKRPRRRRTIDRIAGTTIGAASGATLGTLAADAQNSLLLRKNPSLRTGRRLLTGAGIGAGLAVAGIEAYKLRQRMKNRRRP